MQPASEVVLIQSRSYTVSDPVFISAIAGVVQTLARQTNVTNIQDPRVKPGGGGQISRDGHSVLVQFTIRGDPNAAKDKIAPIIGAIAGAQTANPTSRFARSETRARTTSSASASRRTSQTQSA